MLGVGIIAPLLPIYAESLGATGIWIGVVFAGFSISRAICLPIIGRLSDRTRRRKAFLCAGLLAYAVISLGYVWASQISELTLVRLLHGLAAGMVIPIAQAYIGDLSPKGEEGTWMGYFNAAFFTGFGFGPLMGGVLTDYFSMDTAFYAMGGLNLLAFLLAFSLLPEIHRKEPQFIEGLNPSAEGKNPQSSFREMGKSGVMRGLFTFRLTYAMGRGAFVCFLPFYLGLTPTQIGAALAAHILLMSSFQIFSGKIADRFDKKKLIVIGSLTTILMLALIPMAQNFLQLLALCILGGSGGALSMPAASALTVEEGRKYGMGSAMGVFNMGMSLGIGAGPLIGGLVMDSLGLDPVFFVASFACVLGTGLFVYFVR